MQQKKNFSFSFSYHGSCQFQGFPNSGKGWGEGGGGGGGGGGEEVFNFPISNLSKLKAAFCEYWASLKIEISMICGSKEHEIKQKWYRSNGSRKHCFYSVIT